MSSSTPLLDVWEAAKAQPYYPAVAKNSQFLAGFLLLLTAFVLTGFFGLNRSVVTLPVIGVPASLAFGCISFAPRARLQISKGGLHFVAEQTRVMQVSQSSDDDTDDVVPEFSINLPALLETLQIFGFTDQTQRNAFTSFSGRGPINAFDNRVLGMTSVCRISYHAPGSPLKIVLEEAGVTTTCDLTTYELDQAEDEEIPFAREDLIFKLIMRSSFLHDAITELSSTSPERLALRAKQSAPYFSLSASGSLGSTVVDFGKPEATQASSPRDGPPGLAQQEEALLETFQVAHRVVYSYKFSLIKSAMRAMATADKVCIRGDRQGVLSFQFMIGTEGTKPSFVEFRFVPLFQDDDEDEQIGSEAETQSDD
ncbi:putative DNA repair protein Rad1 [Phyllosticta citriasiana]|uniref:DNA repair protein Rad1 n=1 Tax=Phyllosticta citriasiana TaxID=595635 RepID=A0ABR1KA25_9PEZI